MPAITQHYDQIIVGQGLAGTALALHLRALGQRFICIDEVRQNTSSRVAAGLYNPVTGRKMVKTWRADDLFPYLQAYYHDVEALTGEQFLIEKSIYRPFISLEEQNEWMGKSADPEYQNYIEAVHTRPLHNFTHDFFGGIILAQTGYLKVAAYLEATRSLLRKEGMLLATVFDTDKVIIDTDKVVYGDISADKLILCDGVSQVGEKYFGWLPFAPVKGEILKIKGDFEMESILNRGIFVLPDGDGQFRVGSTYNNHDMTTQPTLEGRKYLEEKIRTLLQVDFEVIDHYAGIRPATKDRRPVVGMHPQFETIGIFNGLGTKGVSLSPYFARQFAHYLTGTANIDPEVNISRFYSLYSSLH